MAARSGLSGDAGEGIGVGAEAAGGVIREGGDAGCGAGNMLVSGLDIGGGTCTGGGGVDDIVLGGRVVTGGGAGADAL